MCAYECMFVPFTGNYFMILVLFFLGLTVVFCCLVFKIELFLIVKLLCVYLMVIVIHKVYEIGCIGSFDNCEFPLVCVVSYKKFALVAVAFFPPDSQVCLHRSDTTSFFVFFFDLRISVLFVIISYSLVWVMPLVFNYCTPLSIKITPYILFFYLFHKMCYIPSLRLMRFGIEVVNGDLKLMYLELQAKQLYILKLDCDIVVRLLILLLFFSVFDVRAKQCSWYMHHAHCNSSAPLVMVITL